MTVPKHLARFRLSFDAHIPARQVENMMPTLSSYGNLVENASRTFTLETQVEGKRKSVIHVLKDWEHLGLVHWEELAGG